MCSASTYVVGPGKAHQPATVPAPAPASAGRSPFMAIHARTVARARDGRNRKVPDGASSVAAISP
jgi:hypothetical protein